MPDRDPLLFTPGPLTTSPSVRAAMGRDLGSRDREFLATTRQVREDLLRLAGVSQADGYEAIPMQGSGTFAVEAAVTTGCRDGILVLANGAYGRRIGDIGRRLGLAVETLTFPENQPLDPGLLDSHLAAHPGLDLVAAVHCETSTGLLNPIQEIGAVVKSHARAFLVDSMSGFGGLEFDLQACDIDLLVTSANKCLQGVPGFGIVIARRTFLEECHGRARSLALDLHDQWQGLEKTGQFRFTPPTHSLLAFRQALQELEEEGGIPARAQRYRENHRLLVAGMRSMGFQTFLPDSWQAPIITSFLEPTEFPFDFEAFYSGLRARGMVIYPGKVTDNPTFRIGNIGDLHAPQIEAFLVAAREVLTGLQDETSRA